MSRKLACIVLALVLLVALASVAYAASVRGDLLNSSSPWIVKGRWGATYKVEWYGGSILFWKGDEVLLTKDWGFATMVGMSGLSKGHTARVWVKRLRR